MAVLYYKEILENERNPEILYKLGKVYEKKYGDIEKAIKYYELADEAKTHYRARYKIGSYYEKRGEMEKGNNLFMKVFLNNLKTKQENIYIIATTTYEF